MFLQRPSGPLARCYVVALLGLVCMSLTAHPAMSAERASHRVIEMDGWMVHVDNRLLQDQPEQTARALELLQDQLRFVVESVAAEHLPKLRSVPVWVSPEYPGVRPGAEYHPSRKWLEENGRNPAMARCIELTNVAIFEKEVKRMPCFVLHELAHAFHDQVLSFQHKEIIATYQAAKKAGIYDRVQRHNGNIEKAYAITNEKEYFAECTEAYFGQNDFYPFNASELKSHDSEMSRLLSEIWGPAGKPAAASRQIEATTQP